MSQEKFVFEYNGYDEESWAAMIQGEGVTFTSVHRKFMEFMAAVYGYDVECHIREMYIRDYINRSE